MSLGRQGRHYLAIGVVQWLVDWGVMVLLSHLGLVVELANIAGRISGAAAARLPCLEVAVVFGNTHNSIKAGNDGRTFDF